MATEFALERTDNKEIGSIVDVQAIICSIFPDTKFAWTTSGSEKLRLAAERGVELPSAIRKSLEKLPALLEGQAKFGEAVVQFGLGHQEPIYCVYVSHRGDAPKIKEKLSALEHAVGGKFVISGEEKNKMS
ncbi:MAG: hypothetical protein AAF593_11465 [Planctomycetota bacterium]